MTLTIPNIESSPTFDGQSVTDATDFAAVALAEGLTGVVSGCAVTPHGADMNIAIAAGTVCIGGALIAVSAVASLAVSAASATDRRDIVVVSNAGAVSVVAGTACGTADWTRNSTGLPPVKPAIPANSVIIAEVYVASNTTTIASGNIVDKTTILTTSIPALRPTGIIAEPYPVCSMVAVAPLTSGTSLGIAVKLPGGVPINAVDFFSNAVALTRGSNADSHMWVAVVDDSLVVKAVSADDTASAWAANAKHSFTMGAAYTPAATALHWVYLMINIGTGGAPALPSLTGIQALSAIFGAAIGGGSRSQCWNSTDTAQTTPPAVSASVGGISASQGTVPFFRVR